MFRILYFYTKRSTMILSDTVLLTMQSILVYIVESRGAVE